MKISISKNEKNYELNCSKITQMAGVDFCKKKYILDSISKYFSKSKYATYEEHMIENICINEELVGRNYFNVIRIQRREDLLNQIKMTKTSLFMQYFIRRLEDFDCQKELEYVEQDIERLFMEINDNLLGRASEIQLEFDEPSVYDLISKAAIKTVGGQEIETLPNYQLLLILLDILRELNEKEPLSRIIIVEDVDHLIEYEEYCEIYQRAQELCDAMDFYFIFSTSVQGYIIIDDENIVGINVINDEIYSLPEFELILEYIQNNYPCQKKIQREELIQYIRNSIHNIAKDNYEFDIKQEIILKMINQTLCINSTMRGEANAPEIAFLNA